MIETLAPLITRRSTSVRDMAAPAPSDAQLETILRIATRVPDHGKLCPWRIIVVRAEGALKLGATAADIFAKQNPDATVAQITAERTRFTRAPLCLAVISTPKLGIKPVWEQELSAGAVCLNILHAANALGFGAKWLTEWVAYDEAILAALFSAAPMLDATHSDGMAGFASPLAGEATRLNERSEFSRSGEGALELSASLSNPLTQPSPARGEGSPRIAGFIYLGTKTAETPDRERPALADVVGEFR